MKSLSIILAVGAIGLLAVGGDVITLEGSPAYAAYLTIPTNVPNVTLRHDRSVDKAWADAMGAVVIQSTNATNNFPAGFVDSLSPEGRTNLVQYLVKGGHVCAVFGHNFRGGRPGETDGFVFADYHPGIFYRTCQICGLCQSQTMGEWK